MYLTYANFVAHKKRQYTSCSVVFGGTPSSVCLEQIWAPFLTSSVALGKALSPSVPQSPHLPNRDV